jgi:hypothetical protein
MGNLRSKLIRLAHTNPDIRPHVLPLLRVVAAAGLPKGLYLPRNNDTLIQRQGIPLGLEIWTWETTGTRGDLQYNAAAWVGKGQKPLWIFRFRNVFDQENKIAETLQNFKAAQARKQQERAERSQSTHGYNVGDILSGSWGYDQTQNNYYEVVVVPSPKVIIIREIGARGVDDSHVVPVPGSFKGPPMKKIPGPGGRVRIESYLTISKWDGKPEYVTPAGFGH